MEASFRQTNKDTRTGVAGRLGSREQGFFTFEKAVIYCIGAADQLCALWGTHMAVGHCSKRMSGGFE